jgi:hypothetical protein
MQGESSLGPAKRWFLRQGRPRQSLGRKAIGGGFFILLFTLCGTLAAQPPMWIAQGPGPNIQGQVENILNREVVGALNAVALHPTDANIVYVGAANGGIWKTANATSGSPAWTPQTDTQSSLSIGTLEFDPTDSTNQTLVAGAGRFSSFGRSGGARIGLLRTADGGASWNAVDGGGVLIGLNISGVAPRGQTIILSANTADDPARQGIWRSIDTGNTWTQVSGGAGTGLPTGASSGLTGDPTNPARLFTNAGGTGLYRSTDTGATWSRVGNTAMNALISGAGRVKVAVGRSNNVYAAIVQGGQLAGLFRSGDGGDTWSALDLPATVENGGGLFGTHPGRQGDIHFSIAADPNNPNIVYIGGDRQPCFTESSGCRHPAIPAWPNSIGARDFTGRLFRIDASQPAGTQATHLTHSNTASRSAPHADSRDMEVAVDGALIEVDDGGIYRRTNPQTNAGDWFSMNGDIRSTEFHAAAWDANADIVIGGTQDTGTPEQQVPANAQWRSVSTADGGVVAVDDSSTPGLSIRYSSNQFLGNFRRRVYLAGNVFQSQVFPPLTVIGGGAALNPQFYTPVVLNAVTPTRLVIGANSVYESLDQGDTIREIGPGIRANSSGADPIAYGGAGNADMLYVGSGPQVFIRTAAHPAALTASTSYPGGRVAGITIDPNDPRVAFVADPTSVYRTTDAGETWTNITGNLGTLDPGTLRSVAYIPGSQANGVVVGSDTGVFHAPGPAFTSWSRFGSGLPRAPVFHLEYDVADGVLLAGTLGRGAWTLKPGAALMMIISDRDPSLAINAWDGAQHGTVLRLHNACRPDNPDCTWHWSNGMLVSNRDPSLAINAWDGAQHGTVLRLHNACRPDNPDCTWKTE